MNAPTLTIVDDGSPRCIVQTYRRLAPVKREVGPIEEGWIKFQTFFKHPVVEHTRPTMGTAKPHPLQGFLNRVKELDHLISTQPLELETVGQELARTGIPSSSLDQGLDDDEYGPSLADAIGPRDPVPYVAPDPALVRRIEWEQFMLACGQPEHIAWGFDRNGNFGVIDANDPRKPVALTPRLAKSLSKVRQGRTPEQIINDRERATFYGGVGSLLYAVATGTHPESADVNEIPLRDAEESEDGPKELAFQADDTVNEPDETDLWPVTVEEIALAIIRKIPLSPPERRWLADHEDELQDILPPALESVQLNLLGLS